MKFVGSFLLSLAIISAANACNIPVFRYALERWRPDPCELVVFHDGQLSPEHERLLERLNSELTGGQRQANVEVVRSNLSEPSAPRRSLWEDLQSGNEVSLPYAVVSTRLGSGRLLNGWHGPLDSFSGAAIFESPARKELSQRLLAGHSIVWLMIGSDDEQRNKTAGEMLTSQFETLAKSVQLPSGIGLPGSELHSEIPLFLRFSLLEIDRDDPQEQFLVQLLSGSQLAAFNDGEPLIIPVFGRGRALEVIPASVMSKRLVEDLTIFLSGACSCQVKEQNPGFDLLLSVNWDAELFPEGVTPGAVEPVDAQPEPVLLSIPPGQ